MPEIQTSARSSGHPTDGAAVALDGPRGSSAFLWLWNFRTALTGALKLQPVTVLPPPLLCQGSSSPRMKRGNIHPAETFQRSTRSELCLANQNTGDGKCSFCSPSKKQPALGKDHSCRCYPSLLTVFLSLPILRQHNSEKLTNSKCHVSQTSHQLIQSIQIFITEKNHTLSNFPFHPPHAT